MLFRHSDNLSKTLQIKDISATEGQHVAAMVKVTLQSICNESSFSGFWQVVTAKAKKLSVSNPSLPRRRKRPVCYVQRWWNWVWISLMSPWPYHPMPGWLLWSTWLQSVLHLGTIASEGETHKEEIKFVMELCHHDIHPDNLELRLKVGNMASTKLHNFPHEWLMRWRHSHTGVDLFTFSHGDNWNKQGGCVTLMWVAALSSGLAVLWCDRTVLWRILFRT